jgi:hypothetical protein
LLSLDISITGTACGGGRRVASPESRHLSRLVQQTRLIGQHRQVGAVVNVQLREHPAQVGADRLDAQEQFAGDLLIGEARATRRITCNSRSESTCEANACRPGGRLGGRLGASRPISRAVTSGASMAWPACTVRTACSTSGGEGRLGTVGRLAGHPEPLGPVEQLAIDRPKTIIVVGQEDRDHCFARTGRRALTSKPPPG